MQQIYCAEMDSPVGLLTLVGSDVGLMQIGFQTGKDSVRRGTDWETSGRPFADVIRQLNAYFRGDLKTFDLPLAPEGTSFQQTVWRELLKIPYAATASYAEIAHRIGKPKATRAVGAANGRNPLPIIVPCHRVIGSDGRLTGYGGGLSIKEYLLALERATALRYRV